MAQKFSWSMPIAYFHLLSGHAFNGRSSDTFEGLFRLFSRRRPYIETPQRITYHGTR